MTRQHKNQRKRYSLEFKAKILLFYQSLLSNVKKAFNYLASLTSIDRRIIGPWIKKSDEIR